jgi:NAD(P)-dependent dehydrogenase (short-subunit alcohol dehydrogenase family)
MLITGGKLDRAALADDVVVVTGAGGGIGFEAARSLLYLGARVVIAEIDATSGRDAEAQLAAESASDRVMFVPTDVSDEPSVRHLREATLERFGRIDVVLNNATYAPAGAAVAETPIEVWDRSYAVNLRGPALLARAVLPAMIARKRGVFVCVSSTGGPFLAPYETLKAAQLALANSLDAELADTGVIAFTIGPGLVPTRTAMEAIEVLAPRLGMTVEKFWSDNRGAVLSVEAAGTGFAAAIVLAERYAGQEISSSQALIDAGIDIAVDQESSTPRSRVGDVKSALELCRRVEQTLADQSKDWKERSFFERQWMLRDFKQRVGMPVERCLETLALIEQRLSAGDPTIVDTDRYLLEKLGNFYTHLGELAQGYVKNPQQRKEQLEIVGGWNADVESLSEQLAGSAETEAAGCGANGDPHMP